MSMLTTLLLSDGRPGHFHLSEGVLAAMERIRPLAVTRLQVRRPRWLTPGLLWRLSASGLSPAVILGYCYGIDATALPKAGLIVSAGGDTLAANIASARLLGAPNVFYGSLRRYDPLAFSLVLTSYERNAAEPRHVMSLKPSRLDPDRLPPLPSERRGAPAHAGLLIGGDAGTVRYEPADWQRLVAFVAELHKARGTRWIVSNSPRTPGEVSDAIARRAAGEGGPIATFIDVRRKGTGTLEQLFATSEAVLVTGDSSSMVSEAVWARRPVVAVNPADMTLSADEQDYRRHLERNGWAASLAIADLTPEALERALARLHPLEENPLAALARTLAEKLGDVLPTPGASRPSG